MEEIEHVVQCYFPHKVFVSAILNEDCFCQELKCVFVNSSLVVQFLIKWENDEGFRKYWQLFYLMFVELQNNTSDEYIWSHVEKNCAERKRLMKLLLFSQPHVRAMS